MEPLITEYWVYLANQIKPVNAGIDLIALEPYKP